MQLILTPKAKKQFSKLPQNYNLRTKKRLKAIENDCLIGNKLAGEFKDLYSVRVWPYRIIYLIDKQSDKIFVVSIIHRQGAYK